MRVSCLPSVVRSVPAARGGRAEHLGIDVGPAVAQDLIDSVPVAGPPGLAEIHFGEDDLLAVAARRTGHGPSGMADDHALPLEGLAALNPDAIGRRDEDG